MQPTAEVVAQEVSQEILATKRTDLMQVDYRNIIVEENFNKRTPQNYGDIEGLALNIVANGVMEALLGHKITGEDAYVLSEGHRRLKAVSLAFKYHAEGKPGFEDISKIQRIPFRTVSADKKDRLIIMASTGFGKVPLTDLEKADLYNELIQMDVEAGMKRGESVKTLVVRLGISQATIYNTLKLNDLPEEIKTALINKEISGSTVISILREVPAEDHVAAVNEAIKDAKATAERDGGKTKATARNVKGLTVKTPMARLRELVEKLKENDVDNVSAKALFSLVDGLDEKKDMKYLIELFS